ncbi:DnaJ homolog subfamily B member 13 [Linum perenne]
MIMVEERDNPESNNASSSSLSDVATQSCDGRSNVNNKNATRFTQEKTCRCFKAKDFWRIYGSVIVKWCHVKNNDTNINSSAKNSRSSSPPSQSHPPTMTTHSSSTDTSSRCSPKAEFDEAEPSSWWNGDESHRVEPQRVEEAENSTNGGCNTATDNPVDPIARKKSKEKDDFLRTLASPLSRIVGRISPTSSPKSKSASPLSSFMHRCISSRKTSNDRDHDPFSCPPTASASPTSLSREVSQRSTNATFLSREVSQRSTNATSLSREVSQRSTNATFLSREVSQRSTNATSLSREVSQRSTNTTTTTTTPRSVVNNPLSRNTSQRSTLIMFSNSTGRKVKPPPVLKNLECTLEELCYGCTKKVNVTRDVLTDRGQIVQEEEELSIQVKPGWRRGTKITFEEKGNERLGAQPADVTFVIVEKGHQFFRREGDDLELMIEIPLVQALTGCDITIPLMSTKSETMKLMIQDIIYPGYKKIIAGQGMPRTNEDEEGKRGDLRVLFLVAFPVELTEEQRSKVVNILEDCS